MGKALAFLHLLLVLGSWVNSRALVHQGRYATGMDPPGQRVSESATRFLRSLIGTVETEKNQKGSMTERGLARTRAASSWRRWAKGPVQLRLVQRSTVWWPTWIGSSIIVSLLFVSIFWWFADGESFLSLNHRLPAEVLVVEGWVGRSGIHAAVAEFEQNGYQYIVASGGPTSGLWEDERGNYAEMAAGEILRLGVPKERLIVAPAASTESGRTFESAVAVRRALQAAGIDSKAINVFTFGSHARRSRLVFAKVDGPGTQVGVISWAPPGYVALPWWRSSERAREMLGETAGYLYEVLFNSGRGSNFPWSAHPAAQVSFLGGWAAAEAKGFMQDAVLNSARNDDDIRSPMISFKTARPQ
jgi:DUF218 domain